MTALGALVRLLPFVAAVLLLSMQPLGVRTQAPHDAVVASFEREAPHRAADIVTRKQRHAASLEEYFAIDDDADEFSAPVGSIAAPYPVRGDRFASAGPCSGYSEPQPTHRPCAGLQTGPPIS